MHGNQTTYSDFNGSRKKNHKAYKKHEYRTIKGKNQSARTCLEKDLIVELVCKYVKITDTVKGFKEIIEGKYDDLPEQAFYMVGTIDEAVEKAKSMV